MQDTLTTSIFKALTGERLSLYRKFPAEDPLDEIANYFWNVALCESLYPMLHAVEIALKSGIHSFASSHFETPYWYDKIELTNIQRMILKGVREKLTEGRKRNEDSEKVINELTFGFWTSFFDKEYEHFWRSHIRDAFPQIPRYAIYRKDLKKRLDKIRRLRNQTFHHEPIWHRRDLKESYSQLVETVVWLSPALQQAMQVLDRFPEIYTQGSEFYYQKLQAITTQSL